MNLYEFEGKKLFEKHGMLIPRGIEVRRGEVVPDVFALFDVEEVVVKAQVLSGKRGKHNGIRFCRTLESVRVAVADLFTMDIRGQYVKAVRIEEKLTIAEEHYVSITYDTQTKQPALIYSKNGGMDIEGVDAIDIQKVPLDIRETDIRKQIPDSRLPLEIIQRLWSVFLQEDCRLVEINPLVKTISSEWYAADAKVALDDDAFFRHDEWGQLESRSMMGRLPTERETKVKKIDEGEKYYQGTAGKYIELGGDIALILNGGGASIANMDALASVGLSAANYTEYSGNPPREKVYELAKIVLSKPGLRGLWMCGVVANFTNVKETFLGIIDALDELQPSYPIVVRRDGPEGVEGRRLLEECAKRNNLDIKIFGKEVGMGETAKVLAKMIPT